MMGDKSIIIELESYATYFRSEQPSRNLLLANKLEKGVSYIKELKREIASLRTDRDGCAKACEKLHEDLRRAKQVMKNNGGFYSE